MSPTIQVPKDPSVYLWIFPTGCINICERFKPTDYQPYLITTQATLTKWMFLNNGNSIDSGSDFTDVKFPITQSGSYQHTLEVEPCTVQVGNLNVNTNACPPCNWFTELKDIEFNKLQVTPYCSYSWSFSIFNPLSYSIQVSLTSNDPNLLITETHFTLLPGNHTYTFTLIPLDGFVPGNTIFELKSTSGAPCKQEITVDTSPIVCDQSSYQLVPKNSALDKIAASSITVQPNPTTDSFTITYQNLGNYAQATLYDLTGRQLIHIPLDATTPSPLDKLRISNLPGVGTTRVNITHLPSGVYLLYTTSTPSPSGRVGEGSQLKIIKN